MIKRFYGKLHLGMPFGLNLRKIAEDAEFEIHKFMHLTSTFTFKGHKYPYFYHRYNNSWLNERTVEVPLIKKILSQNKGQEVLEIGNVLSHYGKVNHDIVDKYEQGQGVLNIDVVKYRPKKTYDLIISISTLEHVGWDEPGKDTQKTRKAIAHLQSLLKPKGQLIFTLPLGYRPEINRLILKEYLPKQKVGFLKRISEKNQWRQASWNEIKAVQYDSPYSFANAVAIVSLSA